jgi:Family of unknown function (DUF5662)
MTREECIKETKEHIEKVKGYMDNMAEFIKFRGEHHDASKLESPELEIFMEYTPKLKDSTYGSPEYNQFLKEMKVALDHHYSNNYHHPECREEGIRGMNLLDIVEMLCDWKAASERHANGDIVESIRKNQKRFNMGEELTQILFNTVKIL